MIRADGSRAPIAGNGEAFYSGDGGSGLNAALNLPQGIFVDGGMNLWIADRENNRIRKVSPEGRITTVASGLLRPSAVVVDDRGNALVADTGHHAILRIASSGAITTVAGTRVAGFSGDGGPAVRALLHLPTALAVHPNGDLLVGDSGNHRVRAISPGGEIRTMHAGEYEPSALALDGDGSLYIADRSNGVVLMIRRDGSAVRIASGLRHPQGLAVDASGVVYVTDTDSHRVVRLEGGGPVPLAVEGLSGPHGLAFDRKGNLLIADSRNHRILMVSGLPTARAAFPASAAVARVPARAGVEGESRSLAPFVPTPVPVIERMLEMARVAKGDVVYDLGSGDGRIPILAALRYGVNAVGIEIDGELAESARKRVSELKLDERVRIVYGDALQADLSAATVVTVYLLPEYMPQLAAALKKTLRPGTRIVSHDAAFEGWRPAQTATIPGEAGRVHNLYLYIYP